MRLKKMHRRARTRPARLARRRKLLALKAAKNFIDSIVLKSLMDQNDVDRERALAEPRHSRLGLMPIGNTIFGLPDHPYGLPVINEPHSFIVVKNVIPEPEDIKFGAEPMPSHLFEEVAMIFQEARFLELIGMTKEMIAYRLDWIRGYRAYHECHIKEAIEAARDRVDTVSAMHTKKFISDLFTP